ncbi:sulfotransferase family 2 domain-containing protein [Salinisphaera sp.]|uniref:sulfotransferase family 2 domain-containing protein n=1 Tax=Salinisphaera sp. TaxID=1914330 RepID=UPI000C5A71E8|nr:sulfotransferase family 2 domain-containing protein [Salinisphaera sp.]MBS63830.1 hypothetical protein [Salinisphaera sp.]
MIAFIHIKKTAGNSIKYLLRSHFGAAHCDVKPWEKEHKVYSAAHLKQLMRVYPWLQSIAGHMIAPHSDLRDQVSDLKYYTFLREPIRRCVSEYQYYVLRGRYRPNTFDSWILDPRYRNVQVQALAGKEDLDVAIERLENDVAFTGLIERFNESLALMGPMLDLPNLVPRASQRNTAESNEIRDSLLADPEVLKTLHKANELDIELYRHARDVVYPRQLERMGIDPAKTTPPAEASWPAYNVRYASYKLYHHAVYKPALYGRRYAARSSLPIIGR